MKLTTKLISSIYDAPLDSLKDINVSKKEIDSIGDITACKQTRKLNLSNNQLVDETSITGLRDLPHITLLNLSNNKLKNFTGLQHLQTLCVLNVSHNELEKMTPHVSRLKELKALILNHNNISTVENIKSLLKLNTIVISHNKLKTPPSLVSHLELTKFSAAHNQLIVLPDLTYNVLLKELRLNDNSITALPESLRQCNAMEILDLGNNQLKNWSDIAALGSLLRLHNLNLKGNPIANKKDYLEKILDLVPSLRILDGERFDPKFLERKKKQRENLNIVEKKQRLKRIKLQKEKKEKKEKGQDIEGAPEEAVPATNKTEKKEKRVVKKQKAPEAPKTKRTAPATEERQVKKAKKEQSDEFFIKGEKANKEQQSVVVETPAAPVQVRTGVVGIVDKSKKMKQGSKKSTNSDVVAALETEDKQESGTGLDVGGWD